MIPNHRSADGTVGDESTRWTSRRAWLIAAGLVNAAGAMTSGFGFAEACEL